MKVDGERIDNETICLAYTGVARQTRGTWTERRKLNRLGQLCDGLEDEFHEAVQLASRIRS